MICRMSVAGAVLFLALNATGYAGTVAGCVEWRLPGKQPASYVLVELRADKFKKVTFTDSRGCYYFHGIRAGRYTVVINRARDSVRRLVNVPVKGYANVPAIRLNR